MTRAFAIVLLTTCVLAFASAPAVAHDGETPAVGISDEPIKPSPLYQGSDVKVDEHVGAVVPLDAKFRTADGETLTLRDALAGDLPVILTFNYSDCPMLCSVQLNALTASLPALATPAPVPGQADTKPAVFKIGEQFRVVTIDLEPNEPLAKLAKMRDRYVARLPEDQRAKAAGRGWMFLAAAIPGDGASIRRVADAVGFKYTYIADRAEWAHPAALTFLAANGTVERYVFGIDYKPDILRESIFAAGIAEPKATAGFMLRCYHFDPSEKDHSRAGVLALRIGAGSFIVLLLTGLGVLHYKRRARAVVVRPEVS